MAWRADGRGDLKRLQNLSTVIKKHVYLCSTGRFSTLINETVRKFNQPTQLSASVNSCWPVEGKKKKTPPHVEKRMSTDSPLPPDSHFYSALVIGLCEGPLFVVLLVKEAPFPRPLPGTGTNWVAFKDSGARAPAPAAFHPERPY